LVKVMTGLFFYYRENGINIQSAGRPEAGAENCRIPAFADTRLLTVPC
jgi:hypothetical protein